MKELVPVVPPPSYISIFEKIRDNKKAPGKGVIVASESDIRKRFIELEACLAAERIEAVSASSLEAIGAELRSCYGQNKGMRALKASIVAAQSKGRLLWCPYCGATTPGSHDHYLPASKFPEFAAHALNLIPACTRCNSTKDDDWLCPAGTRQYIHFYVDSIPDAPFLCVDIVSNDALRAVGATFSIVRAAMGDDEWRLLSTHFRKLKLIELYNYYASDTINTILRSARSHVNAGGVSPAAFLESEALDSEELHGRYGWRAVLLRAMSAHPDLCSWIEWL